MSTPSTTRASIAFGLGTLFFAYAFIQRVAPSVMTDELMREFAVGGAALGGLSAWYFYTYAAIQLPVGILTDRFGPRKLMALAALVCGAATAGFALSQGLLAASLNRAMVGASVAFCFVGTLSIAAYAFKARRFALLAGILQTVGMLGAILGQAPLRLTIETLGWRNTNLVLAVVAVLFAILIYTIIPRRPASSRNTQPDPQRVSVLAGLKAVLQNPQSWWCAGIGFGLTAAMLAFTGLWAVPWLHTTRDFTRPEAAAIASTLFLGWALVSPLAGWWSDYIGRRKPVLLISAAGNLICLALILFGDFRQAGSLSILFLLFGMAGSGMTVVFSAIREVNQPRFSGTALGLMNMFVVGSGAVMQPTIGWLLDLGWNGHLENGVRVYSEYGYQLALASLLATNILALACIMRLRETHCRQVPTAD